MTSMTLRRLFCETKIKVSHFKYFKRVLHLALVSIMWIFKYDVFLVSLKNIFKMYSLVNVYDTFMIYVKYLCTPIYACVLTCKAAAISGFWIKRHDKSNYLRSERASARHVNIIVHTDGILQIDGKWTKFARSKKIVTFYFKKRDFPSLLLFSSVPL